MGREIPYAPMDPPRRVSFRRMQEILAKHTHRILELQKQGREEWFASRLNGHGKEVFEGDTTTEIRASRFRAIIKNCSLSDATCGKRKGTPITYRQIFEEIYGEPL